MEAQEFTKMLQLKQALARINCVRKESYQYLKPKQVMCVQKAVNHDVLVVLPTGYGKSLIFELIPIYVGLQKSHMQKESVVVLVSPLNSIIEEQIERYGDRCIHVTSSFLTSLGEASKQSEKTKKFLQAEYTYVICHAEVATDRRLCEVFLSESWQKQVSHIIVDEVHCVVQWGCSSKDKEKSFRPAYADLAKLRAVFPSARVLGMTATASESMQKQITTCLCLESPCVISASVDRQNITYIVQKRKPSTGSNSSAQESFEDIMQPIVDDLESLGPSFPKTIVYCKFAYCGYGYELVCQRGILSDNPSLVQFVSQFHSECTEQEKQKIIEAMSGSQAKLRLLFATEAYSMGTDVPDIRRIIHISPPTTVETYVQECGRAGRDGKPSTAVMYYNNSDIGPNVPGMTDQMRNYCRLTTCRREFICMHFKSTCEDPEISGHHDCCDICKNSCQCAVCKTESLTLLEEESCSEKTEAVQGGTEYQDKVRYLLLQYFEAENADSLGFGTGLNISVATEIAAKSGTIRSRADLRNLYPHLDDCYADNIILLIRSVQDTECE